MIKRESKKEREGAREKERTKEREREKKPVMSYRILKLSSAENVP